MAELMDQNRQIFGGRNAELRDEGFQAVRVFASITLEGRLAACFPKGVLSASLTSVLWRERAKGRLAGKNKNGLRPLD